MKQCPKGHIYDEKRNGECPYCRSDGNVGFQEIGGASHEFPRTVPVTGGEDQSFPATMPVDDQAPSYDYGGGSSGGMSVTVALDETPSGISPVKGWLVAVDGEKAGICFNVHGEQNSIGRGQKFDINLSFDKTVSSDGNAVIAYDSRNRKFFLSPVLGKGKNNVYFNDSMLLMPVEIKDYDKIQLGTTTYVFRSFCNEGFTY
ncbi:MAG: hypothetical protein NC394_07465 [Bacteroides sp.]|nr:hypothetical protein [Bacteroides sp.]